MSRALKLADSAGAVGAVCAALCCAGTPFIVSALAAVGLSFLRQDAILLPFMIAALLLAWWGFWTGWRMHGSPWPMVLAVLAGAALVAGVIFVHGPVAYALIDAGALALMVATLWNVRRRRVMHLEGAR